MTLVRYNGRPALRSFNNLVDDFFSQVPSLLNNDSLTNAQRSVPVNIRETETEFVLDLVAPGLNKEDFRINLDQQTLTISSEQKEAAPEGDKFIRREFRVPSFKRSFQLNEQVDAGRIVAKYLNGVLTVNLPKKETVKQVAKEITID